MVGTVGPLPAVLDAFRTGGGVPYARTATTCAKASAG